MDFLEWKFINLINVSPKFVPKHPINNIPSLVQIMAWHQPGNKPLSQPVMVSLLMHICVTLLQWIKETALYFTICNFTLLQPAAPLPSPAPCRPWIVVLPRARAAVAVWSIVSWDLPSEIPHLSLYSNWPSPSCLLLLAHKSAVEYSGKWVMIWLPVFCSSVLRTREEL